MVHEQNAAPGLANRIAVRLGARAAVSLPGTPLPGAVVTGNPVRAAVIAVERRPTAGPAAGGHLRRQPRRPAAQRGRRRALRPLAGPGRRHRPPRERRRRPRRGRGGAGRAAPRSGDALDYRLVRYEDRMPDLYAATSIAVCRAGATTVAELAAAGVPSVLVPLPGAPGRPPDPQRRGAGRRRRGRAGARRRMHRRPPRRRAGAAAGRPRPAAKPCPPPPARWPAPRPPTTWPTSSKRRSAARASCASPPRRPQPPSSNGDPCAAPAAIGSPAMPRSQLRQAHPHRGDRRDGHERHRRRPRPARAHGQRLRPQDLAGPGAPPVARRRRPRPPRRRLPARRGRRRRRVDRHPADQPRGGRWPGSGACRCCGGPRPWPPSSTPAARWPSPAPTARRPRRR